LNDGGNVAPGGDSRPVIGTEKTVTGE